MTRVLFACDTYFLLCFSVILLAGEFLKQSKSLLEDGIPARTIIKAVRKATKVVLEKVQKDAFDLNR